MAKLYLFGIGGTGSRVIRSFTMMLAAGVKVGCDEVVPVIIDPDKSNADLSRTVALMDLYRSIHDDLSFPDTNPNQFFRKEIKLVLPNYTLHIQDTNNKTLRQFIDLASMDKSSQAMMRMLFSEKNLNSSMDVGFKGNPNIGSVVLNQIARSDDFNAFANSFQQNDKIFIISSIFGGTGASGFPLLLKTLRNGTFFPNFNIINNAEIGAITMLPYFKLDNNSNSEIDSSTFISKTKSALSYYENNISNNGSINALYFLGDNVVNTYKNVEGGSEQQNDAHLMEFLAATAIVDFSNKTHSNTTNKELGINDTDGVVTFNSFYSQQKDLLFAPLTKLMLMANCLTYKYDYYNSSQFASKKLFFPNVFDSSFMNELKLMMNCYKEWLKELKDNKRSLDLFNLEVTDKPFDIVTGIKPRRILSTLLSDYSLVTGRLNAAAHKCTSTEEENKLLEMFYIGTSRLLNEKFNA